MLIHTHPPYSCMDRVTLPHNYLLSEEMTVMKLLILGCFVKENSEMTASLARLFVGDA